MYLKQFGYTHFVPVFLHKSLYKRNCALDRENEADTYIRLLGMTLCPSLNHVTAGWGKEAKGGGLMTAALP